MRAIVVYPMNALINSQLEALEQLQQAELAGLPGRASPATPGRTADEARNAILDDPPHILLTNYVMLEYMLIRPDGAGAARAADARAALPGGGRAARLPRPPGRGRGDAAAPRAAARRAAATCAASAPRRRSPPTATAPSARRAIAEVGAHAVRRRRSSRRTWSTRRCSGSRRCRCRARREALARSRRGADRRQPSCEAVRRHPLAAWVEETFGLATEDGRLVRRTPRRVRGGADSAGRGDRARSPSCASARCRAVLDAGNAGDDCRAASRSSPSGCTSSWPRAAASTPPSRSQRRARLTTEGQQFTRPRPARASPSALLSRSRSAASAARSYYLAARVGERAASSGSCRARRCSTRPRTRSRASPASSPLERDDALGRATRTCPTAGTSWRARGPRGQGDATGRTCPSAAGLRPDGHWSAATPAEGAVEGWLQPRPLMLCLRCRAAYDLRRAERLRQAGHAQPDRPLDRDHDPHQRPRSTGCRPTAGGRAARRASCSASPTTARTPRSRPGTSTTSCRWCCCAARWCGRWSAAAASLRLRPARPAPRSRRSTCRPSVHEGARRARPGLRATPARAMIDLLDYRALEDLAPRLAGRAAEPRAVRAAADRLRRPATSSRPTTRCGRARRPRRGDAGAARRRSCGPSSTTCAARWHRRRLPDADERTRLAQAPRQPVACASRGPFDEDERLRRAAVALLPGVERRRARRGRTVGLGCRARPSGATCARGAPGAWSDDLPPRMAEATRAGASSSALRGPPADRGRAATARPAGVQLEAGALRWQPRRRSRTAARPGAHAVPAPAPATSCRRPTPNALLRAALPRSARRCWPGCSRREHTGAGRRAEDRSRARGGLPRRAGSPPCSARRPWSSASTSATSPRPPAQRAADPGQLRPAQRARRAGRPPGAGAGLLQPGQRPRPATSSGSSERMIAGAVAPPRIDLANQELVEAHLHSVWLAPLGLKLGRQMADLLDLGATELSRCCRKSRRSSSCPAADSEEVVAGVSRGRRAAGGGRYRSAPWFSADVARTTGAERDGGVRPGLRPLARALPRRRSSSGIERGGGIDRPRLTARERRGGRAARAGGPARDRAPARTRATTTSPTSTLTATSPPRASSPATTSPACRCGRCCPGDQAHAVDRPRFLGLAEFGPRNVLYHEGRKHRIGRCVVPAAGIEGRMTRAKLCRSCGYVHPGEQAASTSASHCGSRMDGSNADFPQRLLDQPPVRALRADAHLVRGGGAHPGGLRPLDPFSLRRRAPRAGSRRSPPGATGMPGDDALASAELWRINHGWRRSAERQGFTIDPTTGAWRPRPEDLADEVAPGESPLLSGVNPYVRDRRNLLLLRSLLEDRRDAPFLKTLAYALQRAIQITFQVEEQEIAVELIGKGEHQRILFWEAAEGGIGVFERLSRTPAGLADDRPPGARALSHRSGDRSRPRGLGGAMQRGLLRLPAQLHQPARPSPPGSQPDPRLSLRPDHLRGDAVRRCPKPRRAPRMAARARRPGFGVRAARARSPGRGGAPPAGPRPALPRARSPGPGRLLLRPRRRARRLRLRGWVRSRCAAASRSRPPAPRSAARSRLPSHRTDLRPGSEIAARPPC